MRGESLDRALGKDCILHDRLTDGLIECRLIDCMYIHRSVYGPRAGRDRSMQQAVALHTRVCMHEACTLVHNTLHTVAAADRGHGRGGGATVNSEPCHQQQQRGGCKLPEFDSKGGPARASSVFFSLSPCEIAHELRTNLLASHSLNSFQLASTPPTLCSLHLIIGLPSPIVSASATRHDTRHHLSPV